MKSHIPSLSGAILLAMSLPASAELKYQNASGGSVLLYGQFNPAYLSFDDGVTTTDEIVDSSHSNSRVGLWLRQPFGQNEFSFNFETALGLRGSAGVSQTSVPTGVDWSRTSIRKVDFSLKTPNAGVFSAGQGSMATDGAAEVDLSGTTLVTYVSVPDTAGSFRFRTAAGALSTRSIAGSFGDFDGGRLARVRYDTPSFGGFTLSASWGTDVLVSNSDLEVRSVALNYAGEHGNFKVKGAIGYRDVKPGSGLTDFEDTVGSISVLHSSGVSLTLASGDRSSSGDYAYAKLGYQGNWFPVGKTALAIDYYQGDDRTVAGSEAIAMGIGAVQSFDKVNIDAYLGYRTYELTEPGASYQDASSILFGARWKF